MKEQTKGTICIENRVRFAETARCLWMLVVPGAIARIMPINSIFFQAGSSLNLLSLWFTLERKLSRIDSYNRSHSDGTRKPTSSHLVAIKVERPTTNIVGILRLSSLQRGT